MSVDMTMGASPPAAFLAKLYGMSRVESEVAAAVAAGESLAAIAAARGVVVSTVRSHLRMVFARMEVRTQAQLTGAAWRAWAAS